MLMFRRLATIAVGSAVGGTAGYYGFEHIRLRSSSPSPAHDPSRLRHCVVLAHGFAGFSSALGLSYYNGAAEFFSRDGALVTAPTVPPFGSIEVRAKSLAKLVEAFVLDSREATKDPNLKANLICHSMAGLDARVAAHMLAAETGKDFIASITTISTPHKGSELAVNLPVLAQVSTALGIDINGYSQLSPEFLQDFDKKYPDLPHVLYFSVAGSQQVAPAHILYVPQLILSKFGPNDGLVTVESSKHGVFLGEYDLNHLSELGWSRKENAALQMLTDIRNNLLRHKC